MIKWYDQSFNVENVDVKLIGTFENLTIKIILSIGNQTKELFKKQIKLWGHQDITSEGILEKYSNKIDKFQKMMPRYVKEYLILKEMGL